MGPRRDDGTPRAGTGTSRAPHGAAPTTDHTACNFEKCPFYVAEGVRRWCRVRGSGVRVPHPTTGRPRPAPVGTHHLRPRGEHWRHRGVVRLGGVGGPVAPGQPPGQAHVCGRASVRRKRGLTRRGHHPPPSTTSRRRHRKQPATVPPNEFGPPLLPGDGRGELAQGGCHQRGLRHHVGRSGCKHPTTTIATTTSHGCA